MAMLSTASYDARKFGVRSGMPGMCGSLHGFRAELTDPKSGFIAKKLCPGLIMVPHHFDHYMDISGKIMNIFREYDPDMLAAGCDEGYLKFVLSLRSRLRLFGLTGGTVSRNTVAPVR